MTSNDQKKDGQKRGSLAVTKYPDAILNDITMTDCKRKTRRLWLVCVVIYCAGHCTP